MTWFWRIIAVNCGLLALNLFFDATHYAATGRLVLASLSFLGCVAAVIAMPVAWRTNIDVVR